MPSFRQTIVVACIGGCFTIIAAIVAGLFSISKPDQPAYSIEQSVQGNNPTTIGVSHGPISIGLPQSKQEPTQE